MFACRLFAAEPAGEAGLGLGGLGLDLAVELVHLLERAGLDVLCVGLGVGLGLGDLGLALLELLVIVSVLCHARCAVVALEG